MTNLDQARTGTTSDYNSAAPFWQNRMKGLGDASAYRGTVAALLAQLVQKQRVTDVGYGAGDLAAALISEREGVAYLILVDPAVGMRGCDPPVAGGP